MQKPSTQTGASPCPTHHGLQSQLFARSDDAHSDLATVGNEHLHPYNSWCEHLADLRCGLDSCSERIRRLQCICMQSAPPTVACCRHYYGQSMWHGRLDFSDTRCKRIPERLTLSVTFRNGFCCSAACEVISDRNERHARQPRVLVRAPESCTSCTSSRLFSNCLHRWLWLCCWHAEAAWTAGNAADLCSASGVLRPACNPCDHDMNFT